MRQARSSTDDPRHRADPAARRLLRLVACAALGLAACAATPPAEAPDAVTVEGCPVPGVETGCLMLRAGDGRLYDITAATPSPALDGRAIRLTGRHSYCQRRGVWWTWVEVLDQDGPLWVARYYLRCFGEGVPGDIRRDQPMPRALPN